MICEFASEKAFVLYEHFFILHSKEIRVSIKEVKCGRCYNNLWSILSQCYYTRNHTNCICKSNGDIECHNNETQCTEGPHLLYSLILASRSPYVHIIYILANMLQLLLLSVVVKTDYNYSAWRLNVLYISESEHFSLVAITIASTIIRELA